MCTNTEIKQRIQGNSRSSRESSGDLYSVAAINRMDTARPRWPTPNLPYSALLLLLGTTGKAPQASSVAWAGIEIIFTPGS